jgi:hypothetical protein
MTQFPTKEAEIVVLMQDMASGLTSNAAIYPSPPIAPVALQARLAEYIAARDKSVAAESAAVQATAAKNLLLLALTEDMKEDIRYAETTVKNDDGKLKLIGWGGRKAKTALQAPGQCRTLEVIRHGEGWVFLDWKEPSDGGKTAAYKIQCKKQESAWTDVGMAIDSEITLSNQERGKSLEYRVIAVNKAGEGAPGNSVTVTL